MVRRVSAISENLTRIWLVVQHPARWVCGQQQYIADDHVCQMVFDDFTLLPPKTTTEGVDIYMQWRGSSWRTRYHWKSWSRRLLTGLLPWHADMQASLLNAIVTQTCQNVCLTTAPFTSRRPIGGTFSWARWPVTTQRDLMTKQGMGVCHFLSPLGEIKDFMQFVQTKGKDISRTLSGCLTLHF